MKEVLICIGLALGVIALIAGVFAALTGLLIVTTHFFGPEGGILALFLPVITAALAGLIYQIRSIR